MLYNFSKVQEHGFVVSLKLTRLLILNESKSIGSPNIQPMTPEAASALEEAHQSIK